MLVMGGKRYPSFYAYYVERYLKPLRKAPPPGSEAQRLKELKEVKEAARAYASAYLREKARGKPDEEARKKAAEEALKAHEYSYGKLLEAYRRVHPEYKPPEAPRQYGERLRKQAQALQLKLTSIDLRAEKHVGWVTPKWTGGSPPFTLEIDWGDGAREKHQYSTRDPGSLGHPYAVYDPPKTFTVKVTVTDSTGASSSLSGKVTITEKPPWPVVRVSWSPNPVALDLSGKRLGSTAEVSSTLSVEWDLSKAIRPPAAGSVSVKIWGAIPGQGVVREESFPLRGLKGRWSKTFPIEVEVYPFSKRLIASAEARFGDWVGSSQLYATTSGECYADCKAVVTVTISPEGSGAVQLAGQVVEKGWNQLEIPIRTWAGAGGVRGTAIRVKAIPKPGYEFDRWEGAASGRAPDASFEAKCRIAETFEGRPVARFGQYSLVARFRKLPEVRITSATYSLAPPEFHISWTGGVPPFKVSIRPDPGVEPVTASTSNRSIDVKYVYHKPGTHTPVVEVVDSIGQSASRGVEIVIPPPPKPAIRAPKIMVEKRLDPDKRILEADFKVYWEDGVKPFTVILDPGDLTPKLESKVDSPPASFHHVYDLSTHFLRRTTETINYQVGAIIVDAAGNKAGTTKILSIKLPALPPALPGKVRVSAEIRRGRGTICLNKHCSPMKNTLSVDPGSDVRVEIEPEEGWILDHVLVGMGERVLHFYTTSFTFTTPSKPKPPVIVDIYLKPAYEESLEKGELSEALNQAKQTAAEEAETASTLAMAGQTEEAKKHLEDAKQASAAAEAVAETYQEYRDVSPEKAKQAQETAQTVKQTVKQAEEKLPKPPPKKIPAKQIAVAGGALAGLGALIYWITKRR